MFQEVNQLDFDRNSLRMDMQVGKDYSLNGDDTLALSVDYLNR